MKKLYLRKVLVSLTALFIVILYGCGNSTLDFVARYAEFKDVSEEQNKAGISIELNSSMSMIHIHYSNPDISRSAENMSLLTERFFIADVRYPDKPLDVSIGTANVSNTKYAPDGTVNSAENKTVTVIKLPQKVKADLLFVGFKGIDSTECAELATPPMFFLITYVEKGHEGQPVFFGSPKLADDFFDATHPAAKFDLRKWTGKFGEVTIGIYNVDKNEDGNTIVELFYEEGIFDSIFSNLQNGFGLPFSVEIQAGNKTVKANDRVQHATVETKEILITKGFLKLTFNSGEEPDHIILIQRSIHGEELENEKLVFDGKTKALIEK